VSTVSDSLRKRTRKPKRSAIQEPYEKTKTLWTRKTPRSAIQERFDEMGQHVTYEQWQEQKVLERALEALPKSVALYIERQYSKELKRQKKLELALKTIKKYIEQAEDFKKQYIG
jgi:hypothetical protein